MLTRRNIALAFSVVLLIIAVLLVSHGCDAGLEVPGARVSSMYEKAILVYADADGIHSLDLRHRYKKTLAPIGEPFDYPPLNDGVTARNLVSGPQWSPDGMMIVFSEEPTTKDVSQVTVMMADGSRKKAIATEGIPGGPRWDPTGTRIVFSRFVGGFGGNAEIYISNADASQQSRITNRPEFDFGATFAMDGQNILFSSELFDTNFTLAIFRVNINGDDPVRIVGGVGWAHSPDYSLVSGHLVFTGKERRDDIYSIFITDLPDGVPRRISTITSPVWSPDFSNDGEWIVFISNNNLWIMRKDGSDQELLVPGARSGDLFVIPRN